MADQEVELISNLSDDDSFGVWEGYMPLPELALYKYLCGQVRGNDESIFSSEESILRALGWPKKSKAQLYRSLHWLEKYDFLDVIVEE